MGETVGEIAPVIEGFENLRPLDASGGFSTVYSADQLRPRRLAAVKVIHQLPDATSSASVVSEADLLAKLSHAHVVGVYVAGTTSDGEPWIAMEFMEGGSTQTHVSPDAEPTAPAIVARLGQQIAGAVSFVHSKGILHLDIKPANVLLDSGGQAKLSDFGIAVHRDATPELGGRIFASRGYTPSERYDGTLPAETMDVYALGATLWALAKATHPPVDGRGRPLPLDLEGIPRVLAEVIQRATRPRPEDRFATAQEMETALRVAAGALGASEHITLPVTERFTRRSATSRQTPTRLYIAAAVAALVAVIAAAIALSSDRDDGLVAVPAVPTDWKAAEQKLLDAGLDVSVILHTSPDAEDYASAGTEPATGTRVAPGTPVRLHVDGPRFSGWGPQRKIVDCTDRCVGLPYPAFNSMIDTPVYGDEKNFVTARIARPEGVEDLVAGWENDVEVDPGDEIEVRLHLSNGGVEPTSDDNGFANRATGVRVHLDWTSSDRFFTVGDDGIIGAVSADNTTPTEVFDSTVIVSDEPTQLHYIRGSAVLYRRDGADAEETSRIRVDDDVITDLGASVASSPDDSDSWYASYDRYGWMIARFRVVGLEP